MGIHFTLLTIVRSVFAKGTDENTIGDNVILIFKELTVYCGSKGIHICWHSLIYSSINWELGDFSAPEVRVMKLGVKWAKSEQYIKQSKNITW